MPEHYTRQVTTDKLEEAISRLNIGQTNLDNKIESIQTLLIAKFDSLIERFSAIPVPTQSSSSSPVPPPPLAHRHHMKLDVPRFDGHKALGWIFKISQFFDYQGVLKPERLTVVSFYMERPTLSWYQWMTRNGFFTMWPAMLQALESRFAPSFYNDPHSAFFKLYQRGTINKYLTEFKCLANRIVSLALPFLLKCFISGLNLELRREV